jgi:hypothetical protein
VERNIIATTINSAPWLLPTRRPDVSHGYFSFAAFNRAPSLPFIKAIWNKIKRRIIQITYII